MVDHDTVMGGGQWHCHLASLTCDQIQLYNNRPASYASISQLAS